MAGCFTRIGCVHLIVKTWAGSEVGITGQLWYFHTVLYVSKNGAAKRAGSERNPRKPSSKGLLAIELQGCKYFPGFTLGAGP